MGETFATSVAANIVSKLLERLFAPIGRQFGYVLRYKSYIKDLERGVKELETAREWVQGSVNEAMYNGKPIHKYVENWLTSVKEETEKVDNLLNRNESAKNACFRGWLPNPVVRHPIGKKVKKITQVIQGLHKESKKSIFQKVYYENTPMGIVTTATSAARSAHGKEDVLESRASIIEDVIKAITDDKFSVIGVYGPGGVGKSKLMDDVERRVKEEQLFDVVATTNVSRNPDLKKIQGDIAYQLGLNLLNVESALGRADLLFKRLKGDSEKKILIILDNLWTKLELKEVGIPCEYNNKARGCKLLLTSRYRDLLYIEMGSDREFQLNVLKHGEARILFERTVGDRVNEPQFKSFVDRVVMNCGGLPLLIVSLANRLKRGDLPAWRNASNNIEGSSAKTIVELSCNGLEDERIKSLFLVCALDSGRPDIRDTLVYCMGLGLYKKFSKTIEVARDRLIMDLRCLHDSSLLLGSDDLEHLGMHDLFIDVAISMRDKFIDTEWNALVGKEDSGFKEWSKNDLRKCTAMAFNYVGIDELPEKLDCPNMRILLLLEHNQFLKVPESFFESMEKLQVLDLTGLSFTSLPSSMEFLENLTSLCLDQCHLEDVTALGKLKGLRFLGLFGSIIARLPKELGELIELRFLDLSGCMLKVIEPGVLESLVNLEELYMNNSFHQWEAEDKTPRSNASLAEFKNMKKLSTLHISIPHPASLTRDLPFGKLNKHTIQIGGIVHWWVGYKEARTLELKLDSDNLLHEVWMQECLGKTQGLHLDGLQDGRDNIHDLCTKGFQELKHLHVKNNLSFHYVVGSTQRPAFTRLESLVLENLDNLEKICRSFLTSESFSKLKIVKVKSCREIKYLFSSSMTKMFLQLEEIQITKCDLMQQIVADVETNDYIDEIDDDANVNLCKLHRLTLRDLPEMTSFCKTKDHLVVFLHGQQVSLPSLESLTLVKLPKLKEVWNSQFPSYVSNLKFLQVEDCGFLESIFPSNLVIKLQNLEAITIRRCWFLQKVFNLEGRATNGDVEILSQLTILTLSDLPRLEHIWNKNPRIAMCFQNLRALNVQNCENLRFLFSSSMAKALQQIKEINIVRCKLLEEIMDVQEEEYEKAASTGTLEFPLLTSLSLKELPNLRTFSHGTYCIHCPTLRRLKIYGCPKMMTFSSFEGKQQSMTANRGLQAFGGVNSSLSLPILFDQNILFPSLVELTLVSCGLMKIWHNELSEESFRKLASIMVRDCKNLSHIFPSTLVERFHSLKMIEVVNCTSLEALMEHVAVNTKERQKRLVFSDLEIVKLWNLPRLNAFVTSSTEATCSLPSLTNVSLRCCHSLRYLFTNNTSRALDKLKKLDVHDCNNMQQVVAMEDREERKLKTVKFSHLHTLKLCFLKSLISFSSGSCAYEFPSLRNLSILECTELKAFILRSPAPRVETMNERSVGFGESPRSLFDEKAKNCESVKSLFPVSTAKSMTQLTKLLVKDCGVEQIIAVEDGIGTSAEDLFFPQLVDLRLLELPELKRFCRYSHASTWPLLKKLRVRHCGKMRPFSLGATTSENQPTLLPFEKVIPNLEGLTLMSEDVMMMMQQHHVFRGLTELELACYHGGNVAFPSNFLLHRFPDLEELSLSCSFFEEIFPKACGHGGATSYGELTDMEIPLKALKNLQRLELNKLCKLQRVWKDGSLMAEILKQIETLLISECSSLSIVLPSPTTFERLTKLEVMDCAGLVHMGTCLAVTSLVHLTWLTLRNCGVMEDVVTDDGNGVEEISFPELEKLILDGLPSLKSFSPMNRAFKFPSLTRIVVTKCPKMNIFCKGALRTPNLNEVLIFEEDNEGRWEGDLNTTIQTLLA